MYQRGRKFEADFGYKKFVWPLTRPGGGGGFSFGNSLGMTSGCVAVCSWPLATSHCPSLEPSPSAGGSAHRPLTPLCPPSPLPGLSLGKGGGGSVVDQSGVVTARGGAHPPSASRALRGSEGPLHHIRCGKGGASSGGFRITTCPPRQRGTVVRYRGQGLCPREWVRRGPGAPCVRPGVLENKKRGGRGFGGQSRAFPSDTSRAPAELFVVQTCTGLEGLGSGSRCRGGMGGCPGCIRRGGRGGVC